MAHQKIHNSFIMKTIDSFSLNKVIAAMCQSHYSDTAISFLKNKGKSTKEAIKLMQECKNVVLSNEEKDEIMLAIFDCLRKSF